MTCTSWSARVVKQTVAEEYGPLAENPIRIYVPDLIEHETRDCMRVAS